MNEEDFRASLHDAVSTTDSPPPMSVADAVHAGRRAVRHRTYAAGGAAVAVIAVVTAAAVAVAGTGGATGSGAPHQVGGPPPASGPALANSAGPTSRLPGTKINVWPTGPNGQPQEDRTARAGRKYDAGQKLLADTLSLVPAGYTAPDRPGTDQIAASRWAQAQFENRAAGPDAWSYLASIEVTKDGRTGRLLVTVYEPGLLPTAPDPCAVARAFWTPAKTCTAVPSGNVSVGLATGDGEDYDRWAAYRYPDGTTVFVAESTSTSGAPDGTPELTSLPLTDAQLATAVLDERFHITAA